MGWMAQMPYWVACYQQRLDGKVKITLAFHIVHKIKSPAGTEERQGYLSFFHLFQVMCDLPAVCNPPAGALNNVQ